MEKWITIEEGIEDIQPRYDGDRVRDHIIPGTFPRPYVIIAFMEESDMPTPPPAQPKRCARCKREIKAQYTHCYRCNSYLKVKARIAKEMSA